MEHALAAPHAAFLRDLVVSAGDQVEMGARRRRKEIAKMASRGALVRNEADELGPVHCGAGTGRPNWSIWSLRLSRFWSHSPAVISYEQAISVRRKFMPRF